MVIRNAGSNYYVETSDLRDNILSPGTGNVAFEIDQSKHYNLCAIGAGLTGTVFTERAANHISYKVLLLDARPHIGGNVYDFIDLQTGIRRNQYGAHLFHTDSDGVGRYVNNNPSAGEWKR